MWVLWITAFGHNCSWDWQFSIKKTHDGKKEGKNKSSKNATRKKLQQTWVSKADTRFRENKKIQLSSVIGDLGGAPESRFPPIASIAFSGCCERAWEENDKTSLRETSKRAPSPTFNHPQGPIWAPKREPEKNEDMHWY